MIKRLVYHVHWDFCSDNEKIYKLHSFFLKKYKNIFDEFILCVSTKIENDKSQRQEALNWINDIFYDKQIILKFIKNSPLRECETFKTEVVDKIDTTNGSVFFGHLKGTTNALNPDVNKESLYRWICACYYFNFEFIDEVEYNFFTNSYPYMFYGSLLQDYKKNKWNIIYDINKKEESFYVYTGTFYWLNCNLISKYKNENLIKLPKYSDRFYAEEFPGYVCPGIVQEFFFQSHKNRAFSNFNFYNSNKEMWIQLSEILGEPQFIDFSDKIINEL